MLCRAPCPARRLWSLAQPVARATPWEGQRKPSQRLPDLAFQPVALLAFHHTIPRTPVEDAMLVQVSTQNQWATPDDSTLAPVPRLLKFLQPSARNLRQVYTSQSLLSVDGPRGERKAAHAGMNCGTSSAVFLFISPPSRLPARFGAVMVSL